MEITEIYKKIIFIFSSYRHINIKNLYNLIIQNERLGGGRRRAPTLHWPCHFATSHGGGLHDGSHGERCHAMHHQIDQVLQSHMDRYKI